MDLASRWRPPRRPRTEERTRRRTHPESPLLRTGRRSSRATSTRSRDGLPKIANTPSLRLRLCNTPQAPRLVTENRAGTVRLSKIVLDGKRPITEGLPVLLPPPSSMRAAVTTPAEPAGARVARFPAGGSLPRYSGGSASASPVSRPAQRSLALRPAWSLNRPWRPVAPECFSRSRYLLQPLRLLPAGATLAGRDSHPQGDDAFPRRTE